MHDLPVEQNRGWYEADAVRDAARGRWPQLMGRFGVRMELLNNKHGPCPGCGGRDRFRFDDNEGNGTWICSQGGGGNISGDGIGLLMHCKDWEWKHCVEVIGRELLPDAVRTSKRWTPLDDGVAPRPTLPTKKKRPDFDESKLRDYVQGVPPVTREWFKQRSKLPVNLLTTADFLEALYLTNEAVLIFTHYYSQGDFLYHVASGKTGYRLAGERNVKAVVSALPSAGREGVWFLVNPVTGLWDKVEKRKRHSDGSTTTEWHWTRRSEINVTRWPYVVLESDDAPEELWLRALAKLEMPIAAIYSSGGRSLHALVKIDAASKLEFDAWRDTLVQLLSPIGADPAAITAVRLSRLPFCKRLGARDDEGRYNQYPEPRMQELIYVNPRPEWRSLMLMKGGNLG